MTIELIVADLRRVRSVGVGRLRGERLAGIVGLIDPASSDGVVDDPEKIKTLLARASETLGGEAREAVDYSLGLTPGTSSWSSGRRRAEAARIWGVEPETFRKAPERNLLRLLAEALMALATVQSPSPQSIQGAKSGRLNELSELEDLFDHARSDADLAYQLATFRTIASALGEDRDPASRLLRAKVLTEQANVLRDQGRLSGATGAFALYRKAEQLALDLNEPRLQIELMIMMASCMEMSGLYTQARAMFAQVSERSSRLPSFASWGFLREATNLIKLGDTATARDRIQSSSRTASTLGPLWHAQIELKSAGLELALGRSEQAIALAENARVIANSTRPLLNIRISTQIADSLAAVGDKSDAVHLIEQTHLEASAAGFSHQAHALEMIALKIDNELAQSLAQARSINFTPLHANDIVNS